MLVIFDCDGVLVDSEPLAAQVFSELLSELNIKHSASECYERFHGHSLAHCFRWIEAQFATRLPDDFGEQLAFKTRLKFEQGLRPVVGVERVLESLQERQIPFCVASNGAHAKMHHSLMITGLQRFFSGKNANPERRYSYEDVAEGKPAPDLFIHAAELMGVPAKFCVVVEDSPTGYQAARAAGMRLLKYQPGSTSQWQSDRECGFGSMDELQNYLLKRVGPR